MKPKIFALILLCLAVYFYEAGKAVTVISPTVAPPIVLNSPKAPELKDYTFGYQSYNEIISVVKEWESLSPLLVETGFYGKTTKDNDCFYFRITNENKKAQYKALITACIHGNEPWSTSTIIAYAGWILSQYGKDERITKVLDTTEVYFIPVVSPDTYPFARMVEGVDPNRNFPTVNNPDKRSIPPVQNIREFFLKINPNATLCGHTYGRVYLVPWGYTRETNPNEKDYARILSKMGELSNYRWMKASELYGSTISGSDVDWYHKNNSFAIVSEFGSHQRKPTENDTETEFQRTKDAFLYFLETSVKVEIKN